MARKTPQFEKSLAQLEALVTEMEEGGLSLEDSLKAFEKGIKLTRECMTSLNEAEQKVQLLIEENGQTQLTSFALDGDDGEEDEDV